VEQVILNFFLVAVQMSYAFVNCADELNLGAMCSAAINSILAGAAGLSSSGTLIWSACDLGKRSEELEKSNGEVESSEFSNGQLSDASSLARRRLTELTRGRTDLKRRFATPEEAWMSIGYDLNNASAAFRNTNLPEVDLGSFASLVEEPETADGNDRDLLAGERVCSG